MDQIQHCFVETTNGRASSPKPHVDASKLAHVVDNRCSVKRKGRTYFFHVPNYPMNLMRNDAKCASKKKSALMIHEKMARHMKRTTAQKEIEFGNACVKNITNTE